jgi:hypothetical protein
MKYDRIKLSQWIADAQDEYVDIPWPHVHSQVGAALIDWLNRQDPIQCQMILEKTPGFQSLWAEFYDNNLLAEYTFKFGK